MLILNLSEYELDEGKYVEIMKFLCYAVYMDDNYKY